MTTFAPIFAPPEIRAALDDRAWFAALLEAEQGLANAGAIAGLVPPRAAALVADCCRIDLYDIDAILEEGRASGNPVEPLVRAIRARVGPEGSDFVHRGATSQDIVDSAAMLVASRAIRLILGDAVKAAAASAGLADTHRQSVMAARTLLQQAVATTFGLKAAGWLVALLDARARLGTVQANGLAVQLGGAAGTLSAFGAKGPDLVRLFARELDLAEPTLPWHTNRVRVAELGSALAALAGVCGKIGLDVTLLSQTEVGEVAEATGPGRGASSTMPHKHNPVGSVLAVACARAAAAAAGLLGGSLLQEHERAAGAWHAEWDALSSALLHTGGAAASIREVLEGLEVFPERMRENLDRSGGLALAEQVSFALADHLGRTEAQALVAEASGRVGDGRTLRDELLADERVRNVLGPAELDVVLDPFAALGAVDQLIDRALARHATENGESE